MMSAIHRLVDTFLVDLVSHMHNLLVACSVIGPVCVPCCEHVARLACVLTITLMSNCLPFLDFPA